MITILGGYNYSVLLPHTSTLSICLLVCFYLSFFVSLGIWNYPHFKSNIPFICTSIRLYLIDNFIQIFETAPLSSHNRPFWCCIQEYSGQTHCGLVTLYGDPDKNWTLAQVMACCPTTPSHYLSQCSILINKVSDMHKKAISERVPILISCINHNSKSIAISPRGPWVNAMASDGLIHRVVSRSSAAMALNV